MDSDGAGFLDVFWDGDRLTFRIEVGGAAPACVWLFPI